MKERIDWIDYAKFFGIFLVVLGHTPLPEAYVNFIYSFHMPLFFFLSGFLFNGKKFDSFRTFFKHRSKQLLIPYVWLSIITYLFWVLIGRKFGSDAHTDISIFKPLLGILYGVNTNDFLIHCGPLWFLPCLFVVELLYYPFRDTNKILLLIIFILVGYGNSSFHHFMLPFSIDTAFVAIIFYAAGNLCKPILSTVLSYQPTLKLILALLFGISLSVLSHVNGRVDMSSNEYGIYPLFLVNGLVGTLLILLISSSCSNFFGKTRVEFFYSINTLIILSLHLITGSFIKGAAFYILKVPISVFQNSVILNLLYTFVTFVALIPVIIVINRYFPFITGNRMKAN